MGAHAALRCMYEADRVVVEAVSWHSRCTVLPYVLGSSYDARKLAFEAAYDGSRYPCMFLCTKCNSASRLITANGITRPRPSEIYTHCLDRVAVMEAIV